LFYFSISSLSSLLEFQAAWLITGKTVITGSQKNKNMFHIDFLFIFADEVKITVM
jgi:hypothetical protein